MPLIIPAAHVGFIPLRRAPDMGVARFHSLRTRSFALRARGLFSISPADGVIGFSLRF